MKRTLFPAMLAMLLATGCITRTVKEVVFDQDSTTVTLRSQRRGDETLPKGFGHPLAISPARMTHILSRIDVRSGAGDEGRQGAIPLGSLYVIGEGMSKAFGKADPDQEIVVMSVQRGKHWGLFDRYYLTSLIAYVREGLVYVHIVRRGWEIPNNLKTELPEPQADEQVMPFRLVPSEGMTLVNPQAVAVSWRDPIFQRPTRTRILPSGKVVRREILMESPEDTPVPPPPTDTLPANLAPDTLRKLADLEEQKSRGEVTQAQYNALRETILQSDPAANP